MLIFDRQAGPLENRGNATVARTETAEARAVSIAQSRCHTMKPHDSEQPMISKIGDGFERHLTSADAHFILRG